MTLNRDLLNLGILFEDIGDFGKETVGIFLDRRLIDIEIDRVMDLDGGFRHLDAAGDTALVIGALLIRAAVKTLALREV